MNFPMIFAWLLLLAASADRAAADINWYYGNVQSPITVSPSEKISFNYNVPEAVKRFTSETAYKNCDFSGALTMCENSSSGCKFRVPQQAGTYYYGSPLSDHCSNGRMKIEVIVVGVTSAPKPSAPQPAPTPVTTPQPVDMGVTAAPQQVTANPYVDWYYSKIQSPITVNSGAKISFNYSKPQSVKRFTGETTYNNCDFSGALTICENSSSGCKFRVPQQAGTYYYGSSLSDNCSNGNMKIKIIVI